MGDTAITQNLLRIFHWNNGPVGVFPTVSWLDMLLQIPISKDNLSRWPSRPVTADSCIASAVRPSSKVSITLPGTCRTGLTLVEFHATPRNQTSQDLQHIVSMRTGWLACVAFSAEKEQVSSPVALRVLPLQSSTSTATCFFSDVKFPRRIVRIAI